MPHLSDFAKRGLVGRSRNRNIDRLKGNQTASDQMLGWILARLNPASTVDYALIRFIDAKDIWRR